MGVEGRTTCACEQCQSCCREQPGFLIPGEMEQIAEYLGQSIAEVKPLFWASPGAVVMDTYTNRQFRIGTITPRYDRRKKRCVFLTDEGLCRIHPVAPYGCAFFDTHMPAEVGRMRSAGGMRTILESPEYKELRSTLPFADHYKPKGY